MAKKKVGLPPLDWLRVFESAGRLGGFSAAAREFGLTQAAVSQRIGNLETWLGRSLFVREARGVSLTIEGESYLPLVQDSLQALERNTEDLFGKSPRELRVAGLSSNIHALVVPSLARFQEMRPKVRVMTDSVARRSSLDEERTWLQIRYGRGIWPGRDAELIAREVLVPMAAPDVDWDAPLIDLRGERPGWRDWARKTDQGDVTPSNISFDSMEHALSAARQGMGVALGSVPLAKADLQAGRLRRLNLPELKARDGYWLAWPEERAKSKKQRALIADFLEALRG
ncbi:LysR substrate-binding domain-containing protein [Ruegeria sp. Ofav3-42]|uniref:LysR substrate-binding domain-containing protein n=1 Tax=Ruegeria sp. Ofav3-42 TaxID=2917759 RepID=UPI001EF3E899|nr:LysR substrate-binding domain-containing protein [Ruegeria sp. Ofav3-42]MCG7521017.1 LysR substrate-binding domain-containing protein [Ruegeria sp. Ofav3-42]